MSQLSVFADFDHLPTNFNGLFEGAQRQSFYFGLPWYRNFLATVVEPSKQVQLFAVTDDKGEASALLPLWSDQIKLFGLSLRRLEALQNYYSGLYAPALDQKNISANLAALGRGLKERGQCDIVDLKPLDGSVDSKHTLHNELMIALKTAGFVVQPYFCFGNWYLNVAGRSFDEYYAGLSSQLKNTVKRKAKQFQAQAGSRIDIIIGSQGLEEAVAAYERVYLASWKTPEPYPEFMPGLMRTCAEQGWLRMGVAYIDGQAAAAQVWVVCNGVASIFKLAYDEKFAKFSVGSLLTTQLMRHAIDVDKVHTVDYLCGDDAYKRDWMSHRRERWGIMAFNPHTLGGLLSAARHVGGHAIKSWVKKLRDKAPLNANAHG